MSTHKIIDLIMSKPKQGIALLVFVVVFFIAQIPNFQLDASSDSLVLEGDKSLRIYQSIDKDFGTDDALIVSYQVQNSLLEKDSLSNLKNLRDELRNINEVKSVTTILDVPLFKSPPLELTDLASSDITIENGNADLLMANSEFTTSPLYSNNLVSLDGKTTAILISLSEDLAFKELRELRNNMRVQKNLGNLSKNDLNKLKSIEKKVLNNANIETKLQAETIAKIRSVIGKYRDNVTIFLGGLPMITNDIISYIGNDLIVFSIAVIGLMTLILTVIFKSLRWILMPIVVSVSGALTMTGLLAFLDWKVTVISSNFFSLLLVMTFSVTIHLIVRYRELAQNRNELGSRELIKETLMQMFKPCLFTTLTTFAAFSSLLISGIRPVIDFGWMMSIGITIAMVLSFLAFPMIMSLIPKAKIIRHKTELNATINLAKFSEKFGNQLIIVLSILAILSVYGISKLSVENRFIDYFKKDTEINQGLSLIDNKLGGTIPLEIVFDDLAEDYWFDEDLRDDISNIHQYIENLDETGKVLSIDTLMQILTQANKNETLNGFFLSVVKSQIPENAKDYVYYPYLSEESGKLRIVARIKETNKDLRRDELINQVKNYITNSIGFKEESFHMSGMLVLYNNMLQSLFDSQIKTIAVVFAMIFIMFLIIFKSLSLSILALIPNTLPSLFILGLMGAFNIPLDLMTITIAAIAIGIGVDNAIHYIHRYSNEFVKDNDYIAAMYRSHGSIGLAMFYTSITVAVGFLILSLSNFIPSIYFGIFTATAMLSALIANLTLLPKLIIMFKPEIKKTPSE